MKQSGVTSEHLTREVIRIRDAALAWQKARNVVENGHWMREHAETDTGKLDAGKMIQDGNAAVAKADAASHVAWERFSVVRDLITDLLDVDGQEEL